MAKSNGELLTKMEATKADKPTSLETQVCEFLSRDGIAKEMTKYGAELLTPERLTRIVMTCIRTTPELAHCTIESLLACMMKAQQFQLEPGGDQCYLIPRNRNIAKRGEPERWIKECTFMIGYQGYIELIHRAHPGCGTEAHPLYSNDKFVARRGYEGQKSLDIFLHEEAFPDRGELVGYYAYFRPMNGQPKYERMTLEEVNKIRDDSGNKTLWMKHPVQMGRKTAVRRLFKYIPKSPQSEMLVEATRYLGDEAEQKPEFVSLTPASRPTAALDAPQTTIDATFHENEAQPTLGLSDSQSDLAFELEQ